MMRRKLYFIVSSILILRFSTRVAWSQENDSIVSPLSFEDALLISMENNFGIKEKTMHAKAKEQELKAARGLYLPHVSLNASYIAMSQDILLDLNPLKDAITPLYSALGNYGNFSGVPNPDPGTNPVFPTLPDDVSTKVVREKLLNGLEEIENADWTEVIQKKQFGFINAGFSYPIYAGGKIRSANKAAHIYYDEATNEVNIKKSELATELVERYYGLVLAEKALEVRTEVLVTMTKHMHDAQRLKEEGVIADAEYLHAKVYFSEAVRELKKSNRQIAIAKQGLNNTLSNTSGKNWTPITSLFYLDSIPPLSYFLEQSENESFLLKKVEHKRQLAATKYHVEKGAFMPTIAVMGTYQIANKDLSPLIPNYLVGVGLKWDVFEGAARLRKMKAAKLQQEQVDFIYNKTEEDISTVIAKYYEELHMYKEQMEDLKSAQAFASEYYRVRNKAFSEGMATATDISDANLALAKVKIEMLQAMYQFDVTLSKLLQYAGRPEMFTTFRLMAKNQTSLIHSNHNIAIK